MRKKSKPFVIAGSYDTETCNICLDEHLNDWHAFPVLYIFADLRGVDLRTYEAGDAPIQFERTYERMIGIIEELIEWGIEEECIPIVCAYNLMFDLQPIIYELNCRHDMCASAQSSTHVYTLDLLDCDGNSVLRFWDTFYLEMRGLDKMGETCGLEKAVGSWDYDKVRTPYTPLTDSELHYAGRDVEVIPAYLRYLLESNEWLEPGMLGVRVLTKTSLVRQAGKNEVGRLRIPRAGGKRLSVQAAFERLCAQEFPKTYAQYALRKACFRGGLTFTSARYALTVQKNVVSIDETSAHHAYINGHMLPVKFKPLPPAALEAMCDRVRRTSLDAAMRRWEEPFGCAFHVQARFANLRLKKGSAFSEYDIAVIPEGKFKAKGQMGEWGGEADRETVTAVRSQGFQDVALNARFAFGKLVSADSAVLHICEMEMWCISMVYDFDSFEVVLGEGTSSFVKPPDYVTLLSNLFYARKDECKRLLKIYREGESFTGEIAQSIPDGIAKRLRDGSMTRADLESYYGSTVKGQFNSIYGMEAQDVLKCGYLVSDGAVHVDKSTVATRDNWPEKYEEGSGKLVLYTYGMRIVGGSRMALVAAIESIYRGLGDKVRVLGGDTDSLKVSINNEICPDDLIRELGPFHDAVTRSIDVCMERVRGNFPDYASPLTGVGTFEIEGEPYKLHMDAWNKARVSWDGEHAHITCAGLSRPSGSYHIENWLDDMSKVHGFPFAAMAALGFGVRVAHDVCHALEHSRPAPWAEIDCDVMDYLGKTVHVRAYESIALYPSDRVLGDVSQGGNARSVDYLKRVYNREVETHERFVGRDSCAYLMRFDDGEEVRIDAQP